MVLSLLITGSSGFLGKNLQDYLLSNSSSYKIENYNRFVSNKCIIKNDVIIHLAGKAHDLKKVLNPQDYYDANFELTKKLYVEFLNSKAQKFIFISSVKASSDNVEDVLFEIDKPKPQTHYGKSKLQAEQFIQSMPLPSTKSYYIIRPCMIHGTGNKGNLNLLYSLVSKGFPWPLGAFENRRSFLSIENLCFVIKELLSQTNIPSGIYNVADDEPLSTNELIRLMAVSQKKHARIVAIPKSFIIGIAKLGDKLHLPLNTERLQKLTESYVVSNAKIKQAIGKPFPVNAKEGLLKTFGSFRTER